MALGKTTKIRLYTTQEEKQSLLSFLQDRSCFQFASNTNAKPISRELSRLEFAIQVLSEFGVQKKGIRNAVLGEKIEVEESEVEKTKQLFDSSPIVSQVEDLESRYNTLQRNISQVQAEITLYEPWKDIDTPLISGSVVTPYFIIIPNLFHEDFLGDLSKKSDLFTYKKVRSDEKFSYYLIYFSTEESAFFTETLSNHKGEKIDYNPQKAPSESYEKLKEDLKKLNLELNNIKKQLDTLSEDHLRSLKIIYDESSTSSVLSSAIDNMNDTTYLSYVDGWMRESDIKMLQYDLEKRFTTFHMEELDVLDNDTPPVFLHQSSTLSPAGEITNMYGTPNPKEVDPTAYLAPFYILFFGLCLTDAGYGLLLAGFTGIALYLNLPFEKSVKNVIKLFFYSGISTFILGVLFGGYFGLTAEQVPEAFTYLREVDGQRMFLGQIFNPMTDLATHIMPITYAIGFIHLILGLILSARIAWVNGDKQRTFLVALPMILAFCLATAAWGMGIEYADYLFYACLGFLIWGLGKSGSPIIRILKGVGGLLNEGLSWFQNILSYSRLFALGLATGVIAMAFNIIAEIFGDLVPGIGGVIIMIVILLFGHTLNIALNVLGAYVHSARLQFVEFFGMFLEGGGRLFKPFSKTNKYRFNPNL